MVKKFREATPFARDLRTCSAANFATAKMSALPLFPKPIADFYDVQNLDPFLDRFRCNCCSQYLIYSPIMQLASGLILCGRCAAIIPANDGVFQDGMEEMLKQFTFPCRYTNNGCNVRFPFGAGVAHEIGCEHNPSIYPEPDCDFNMPFRITLAYDSVMRSLLPVTMSMALDIYFHYKACEKKLYYVVRKLPDNRYSYAVHLMNFTNNRVIIVNGNPTVYWEDDQYLIFMVNLNNFLVVLLNPVMVSVDVVIKKVQ